MTEKERYQRAFSALHTSDGFQVRLEETKKPAHTVRIRRVLTAACVAMALAAGATAAYASNAGGIQRTIQIWLHGELTDATLDIDDSSGTYAIREQRKSRRIWRTHRIPRRSTAGPAFFSAASGSMSPTSSMKAATAISRSKPEAEGGTSRSGRTAGWRQARTAICCRMNLRQDEPHSTETAPKAYASGAAMCHE